MEIYIKDLNKFDNLNLIDKNGINYIQDFVGNYNAIGDEDWQFAYDDTLDIYICNAETFGWWTDAIAKQQWIIDTVESIRNNIKLKNFHKNSEEIQAKMEEFEHGLNSCACGDLEQELDEEANFLETYLANNPYLN